MKLPIQFEIPRRASLCSMGQENLASGTEYYSMLSEDHAGIIRKDYCGVCWQQVTPKTDVYWKSRVPDKAKENSLLPKERSQRAFILLKEALENPSTPSQMQAFILALYLVRKKILSAKQTILNENNSPVTLYEVRENEEILLVPKFDFTAIPIEELQKNLADQLKT